MIVKVISSSKFTSRDDGTGRGHVVTRLGASILIIYDFYYAVKMREFLQPGPPRSRVDSSILNAAY